MREGAAGRLGRSCAAQRLGHAGGVEIEAEEKITRVARREAVVAEGDRGVAGLETDTQG